MTGRKTGLGVSLAAAVAIFCGGCTADGTMTEDTKREVEKRYDNMTEDAKRDIENWYDDMTQDGRLTEGGNAYWDGYGIHAGDEAEYDGDGVGMDSEGGHAAKDTDGGNIVPNDEMQK